MAPRTGISVMASSSSGNGGAGGNMFTVREREAGELEEAKQRASIKWLLSKAYAHKTPPELREPFYKDHEDSEHLKPHIVHALANAELYCMALSNLYSDPNYHNLNHWGVIQALARKGVFVAEPADCSLTETVLIQTTPLKMSAHMAVTEALMSLFLKEQVQPAKVAQVVDRMRDAGLLEGAGAPAEVKSDPEEALLSWADACCKALKKKAMAELVTDEQEETNPPPPPPTFPTLQDLSDLSDGVALAAVAALYCPEDMAWTDLTLGDPPSMADSLYNIRLLQRFCSTCLPFDFCHLTIEDVVYLHASVKQNVGCLLADLYLALEARPFDQGRVRRPGVKKNQVIEVPEPDCPKKLFSRPLSASTGAIPHLRPSLNTAESTRLITDMHRLKSPVGARKVTSPSSADKSASNNNDDGDGRGGDDEDDDEDQISSSSTSSCSLSPK